MDVHIYDVKCEIWHKWSYSMSKKFKQPSHLVESIAKHVAKREVADEMIQPDNPG